MKTFALALMSLALAGCATVPPASRSAGMWLTTADETQKLAAQP